MKKMNGIGSEEAVAFDDARSGMPPRGKESFKDFRLAYAEWMKRRGLPPDAMRQQISQEISKRKRK